MKDKSFSSLDNPKKEVLARSKARILIDMAELSELLSISIWGIRWMVRNRDIPIVKIGRRVRFDRNEILEWIQNHKINPSKDKLDRHCLYKSSY